MADFYKLVGKQAVPCTLLEWSVFFNTRNRCIIKTKIKDSVISTVFLGINHNFGPGDPLLFETMVFGGPLNEEMNRYTTWEEAEEGHTEMVKAVVQRLVNMHIISSDQSVNQIVALTEKKYGPGSMEKKLNRATGNFYNHP